MKKLFTLIAVTMIATMAMAKDYTDKLSISVAGSDPFESTTTIAINEEGNGKYTIMLKQFSFMGLLIGDVTMTGVEGKTDAQGFTNYATTQDATITNGDPAGIQGMLGGKINVTVKEGTRSKGDKFYALISLTVPGVGDVNATFGDNNFTGTSIDNILNSADGQKVAAIYTTGGARVSSLVRGINILKLQNGETVKVMRKY